MQPILYLSNPELIVRQLARKDRREVRVWKVEGTLVQETAAALKFVADEILSGSDTLCLDLSLADFVDGSALAILKRMQFEGIQIVGHSRLGSGIAETDSPPADRRDDEANFGNTRIYFA
jgi:ABC-type transporter Mla MlaB component